MFAYPYPINDILRDYTLFLQTDDRQSIAYMMFLVLIADIGAYFFA